MSWRQRLFQNLVTWLERTAFRLSTRKVIAISELIRRDLATYFHRRRGVEVIHHGVDLDTFHPRQREVWRGPIRRELGISEDRILVLFVGNPDKGAAPAIEAVSRVSGIDFAIVSGAKYDRYREIAEQFGVADRVHFCPATATVERHFAAADIFLFPTIYDPFGMVISEAMASGLPTITSSTAGASEWIDHGRNGLLTHSAWSVEEITMHLRTLVNDGPLRIRIGNAARVEAERHTWDSVAERTMAVYRDVVAGRV